jgi:hypothetical protein
MFKQYSNDAIRRILVALVVIFLGFLVIAACGQGKRKNPTRPVATLTPSRVSTGLPVVSGMLKIGVDHEGLYEVSSEDIKTTMPGWEEVDPDHLRLSLRGQEQPIWIVDRGEQFSIRFYGIPSDSRYTGENTYLLTGINGTTHVMGEKQLPGANSSPAETFQTTIRFEQNNLYAPLSIDGDHFFWLSLAGRKKQDFEVELPQLAPGGGRNGMGLGSEPLRRISRMVC